MFSVQYENNLETQQQEKKHRSSGPHYAGNPDKLCTLYRVYFNTFEDNMYLLILCVWICPEPFESGFLLVKQT